MSEPIQFGNTLFVDETGLEELDPQHQQTVHEFLPQFDVLQEEEVRGMAEPRSFVTDDDVLPRKRFVDDAPQPRRGGGDSGPKIPLDDWEEYKEDPAAYNRKQAWQEAQPDPMDDTADRQAAIEEIETQRQKEKDAAKADRAYLRSLSKEERAKIRAERKVVERVKKQTERDAKNNVKPASLSDFDFKPLEIDPNELQKFEDLETMGTYDCDHCGSNAVETDGEICDSCRDIEAAEEEIEKEVDEELEKEVEKEPAKVKNPGPPPVEPTPPAVVDDPGYAPDQDDYDMPDEYDDWEADYEQWEVDMEEYTNYQTAYTAWENSHAIWATAYGAWQTAEALYSQYLKDMAEWLNSQ